MAISDSTTVLEILPSLGAHGEDFKTFAAAEVAAEGNGNVVKNYDDLYTATRGIANFLMNSFLVRLLVLEAKHL